MRRYKRRDEASAFEGQERMRAKMRTGLDEQGLMHKELADVLGLSSAMLSQRMTGRAWFDESQVLVASIYLAIPVEDLVAGSCFRGDAHEFWLRHELERRREHHRHPQNSSRNRRRHNRDGRHTQATRFPGDAMTTTTTASEWTGRPGEVTVATPGGATVTSFLTSDDVLIETNSPRPLTICKAKDLWQTLGNVIASEDVSPDKQVVTGGVWDAEGDKVARHQTATPWSITPGESGLRVNLCGNENITIGSSDSTLEDVEISIWSGSTVIGLTTPEEAVDLAEALIQAAYSFPHVTSGGAA